MTLAQEDGHNTWPIGMNVKCSNISNAPNEERESSLEEFDYLLEDDYYQTSVDPIINSIDCSVGSQNKQQCPSKIVQTPAPLPATLDLEQINIPAQAGCSTVYSATVQAQTIPSDVEALNNDSDKTSDQAGHDTVSCNLPPMSKHVLDSTLDLQPSPSPSRSLSHHISDTSKSSYFPSPSPSPTRSLNIISHYISHSTPPAHESQKQLLETPFIIDPSSSDNEPQDVNQGHPQPANTQAELAISSSRIKNGPLNLPDPASKINALQIKEILTAFGIKYNRRKKKAGLLEQYTQLFHLEQSKTINQNQQIMSHPAVEQSATPGIHAASPDKLDSVIQRQPPVDQELQYRQIPRGTTSYHMHISKFPRVPINLVKPQRTAAGLLSTAGHLRSSIPTLKWMIWIPQLLTQHPSFRP
ncbi:hypothetical protein PCANC_21410 [Puccinia coronata f. sp. avenae]|uniref:HeH/LEM domain-containing protein n=1 Tax=Puccinia coronata f. sp. avenae TaxID=200324 RepID=A0A2N5UTP0_9BASI|nr:hypothetical protein PCANC_27147 [Puccinia coronata f. sp. avenae]PLW41007.1 hypothetical protein PCANC_21410 [Puccinia coronata f. sp. avenae]